jgi:hypothetical protein
MRALQLAVISLLVSCSLVFGTPLENETVTAACGLCIFGQQSPWGCFWAIEYEGAYYPVNGLTPPDHDSHGPEGMCTTPRQAVVTGRIRKGKLMADHFTLLPLDPSVPRPAAPAHTHEH